MIDEQMKTMTPPALGQADTLELRWKIARAVILWLEVVTREGGEYPYSLRTLQINMDHSALLNRILSGTPPLPTPPPIHLSYPWYELIDDGFGSPLDVWEAKGTWAERLHDYDCLMIDHSPWRIVGTKGPNDWLVMSHRSKDIWRVWSTGPREQCNGSSSTDHHWRIERYTPETLEGARAP